MAAVHECDRCHKQVNRDTMTDVILKQRINYLPDSHQYVTQGGQVRPAQEMVDHRTEWRYEVCRECADEIQGIEKGSEDGPEAD